MNVFTDRLVSTQSQDVKSGTAQVKVPVGKDWGTGAYMVADLAPALDAGRAAHAGPRYRRAVVLDRPLGAHAGARSETAGDAATEFDAQRTGKGQRPLPRARKPALWSPLSMSAFSTSPITSRPRPTSIISVSAASWRKCAISTATDRRHAGRRAGKFATAAISAARNCPARRLRRRRWRFIPGIVTVGPDGTAQVNFDIPAFAGTARVMAVAWTKDKVGKASGDVVVRDSVVLTATLPRSCAPGDRGNVQLELDNVEGATGDYNVATTADGTVKLDSDKPQVLKLAAKQRDRVSVRCRHWARVRAPSRSMSPDRTISPMSAATASMSGRPTKS
ncbi:MAG: alpha-2-macroglobulin family protein [Pseudolabrys sp.]